MRSDSFDKEQHPRRPHLHHLLQDRLPKLGLDADTYGKVITIRDFLSIC